MGLLSKIFGGNASAAVDGVTAVGNVLDNLFTSKDEKLTHKEVFERLSQQPHMAQVELNKLDAQSRFWFQANWRPFIGWVCGSGVLFMVLINPLIQWFTDKPGPELPESVIMQLTLGMLGLLGTMRTVEKIQGKSK